MIQKRLDWNNFQKEVSPSCLVFLDESSEKTNMTRLYERAMGGNRCLDNVPHGHWKSMTMLSSMRIDGQTECLVFDGALTREIFDKYIIEFLCPALRPGDIVILDNLPAHKSVKAKEAIEACGASLLYLPPYSPDLNPIENMWSKIKQLLRGLKKRTWLELQNGIAWALSKISPEDALGWFKHCGYRYYQV